MVDKMVCHIVRTGKAHSWLKPFALLALIVLVGGAALAEWAVTQPVRAWKAAGRFWTAFGQCREQRAALRSPIKGKPFRPSHRPASRAAAVALSVCMVFTAMPQTAFAAEVQDGLCEHHEAHTIECGYAEAVEGQPCEHEHRLGCYTDELICGLEESETKTASGSDAGHTHTQDCYALDCPHERGEHTEDCGYTEDEEGTPCGYVCTECGKPDKDSEKKPETIQPEGAEGIIVTAFDPLDRDVRAQTVNAGTKLADLNLPATLGASGYTASGGAGQEPEAITITGVTWEPTGEKDTPTVYEEGRETPCSYYFRSVLPQGYSLADGAELPEIYVTVGERPMLFSSSPYNTDDIGVINTIITNNSLNVNKDDPEGWATSGIVQWNSESPKRIEKLNVSEKQLTGVLDVSGLEDLATLNCYNNSLSGLNLSGLTNLTYLSCYNAGLAELDVSGLTSLTTLICNSNRLETLNISGLTNLHTLHCQNSKLTALDVSGLTSLNNLMCANNPLASLKLSDTEQLTVGSVAGGTVELTGYTHNTKSVTLTATTNSGKPFQEWQATGTSFSTSSENPVTFPLTGSVTITPVFEDRSDPTPTVENSNIYANGTPLLIVEENGNTIIYIDADGDGEKDPDEKSLAAAGVQNAPNNGDILTGHYIFGGGKGTTVNGNTQITMTGGTVGIIFGGGQATASENASVTGTAVIKMTGGKASLIYGGGRADQVNKTASVASVDIIATGGTIGSVYGGGYANKYGSKATVTGTVTMEISGVNSPSGNVFGGGQAYGENNVASSASVTGDITVRMTSGTVESIYGGGQADGTSAASSVGRTGITVSGGTIGSVYGGGNVASGGTATVSSRTLKVGGAPAIGDADNPGIVINHGSVTNGVDSFAINSSLTGADGSIQVTLPANYDVSGEPTIATSAAQGDLAKIKLAGGGATGKQAFFDGDNNVIKVQSIPSTYGVTYKLTNLSATGQPDSVNNGAALSTTLTPANSYKLPSTITVTMGGSTLTSGTGYTYNSITGAVSIASVTGDVVITAVGVAKSSDATLSALTLSAGTLNPSFQSDQTSYTATVGSSMSSVTVTPTVNESHATVKVNNEAVSSGAGKSVTLAEGENTITIAVTAEDGTTTKIYTVTVTRESSVTPTYGVTLDPSGNKTFTEAIVGYGEQAPHSVTVRNSGNQPTGVLTVGLSGTNAGSFTLSKTNIDSIAANGSDSFTVKPATGLDAGAYTATVTVSGNNSISASFTVSFTVNAQTPSATAPTITTSSLPGGTVGTAYSQTLAADGTSPFTWTLESGSLPGNLSMNSDGTISGTPNAEGTFTFTVKVENSKSSDTEELSIVIDAPTPSVSSVAVSPSPAIVQKGSTQQFTANVTGTNNPAQTVTWSIEGDRASGTSISNTGLLTVASDESQSTLTVKAISTVDSTKSGTATVTVTDQTVTHYTLTVSGGTGSGDYAEGAQITVTANSETGKRFKEWTVTGITLNDKTANPVTITMPANAVTLTATYDDLYAVTTSSEGGGTATASPNTAAAGETVTITANANDGYQFKEWQVVSGGVSLTNANAASTSFTMPGAAVEVKAIFEAVATHTITASAGSGGTISPDGTVTVNEGESQTFTITTDRNYAISQVTVDGVDKGTAPAYTFENVTADHSISVTFRYIGGGSSGVGGGSSSGGGGSTPSGGSSSIPSTTTSTTARENGTSTTTIQTTSKDSSGKTTTVTTEITKDAAGNTTRSATTVTTDNITASTDQGSSTVTVKPDAAAIGGAAKAAGASETNPMDVSVEVPQDTVKNELQKADVSTVHVEVVIPKAVEDNPAVRTAGVTVEKETVEAARQAGKNVIVTVREETGAVKAVWSLDGQAMGNTAGQSTDLNLGVHTAPIQSGDPIAAPVKPPVTAAGQENGLVISLTVDGTLLSAAKLTVPATNQTAITAGSTVALYRFDPDTGVLSAVPGGVYSVDANGNVTIDVPAGTRTGEKETYVLLPVPSTAQPAADAGGGAVHTVKAGDTLNQISRQYGCRVEDLLALNPGVDIYNLQIGSGLRVR